MTTLIARQPLQTLSMSSSQRGPRRLSARLQEKEDAQPRTNGYHLASTNQLPGSAKDGAPTRRAQDKPPATKKRKIGEATRSLAGSPNWMGRKLMESSTDYDEEDDGFMFTRAKARKSRPSASKSTSNSGQATVEKENSIPSVVENVVHAKGEPESEESLKKRRNRMSFSTTNVIAEKPVRRSKRLSDEAERRDGSAQSKARKEDEARVNNSKRPPEPRRPPQQQNTPLPPQSEDGEDHSETKIALPFADTPVIRKNKAMRERKSGKGERRSSLGLRGRRASSLIDSGSSNALPHSEVDVVDFFKHIESEGLSEPRRMRQLLTWCATRAMGEPSTGSPHPHPVYEDQSARLAARVIQKELLKDFANRSEMSDWFGREDVQKVEKPLPMKPNPKNIRNAAKIEELETQIKRLRFERQSLEALLRPPSVPHVFSDQMQSPSHAHPSTIDTSLLSNSDTTILETLNTSSIDLATISSRVNNITSSVGPTIDVFADGIHKVAQYRHAAERISGRVLGICAEKLEERAREARRRAIGETEASSGDLTDVLRSLSKTER